MNTKFKIYFLYCVIMLVVITLVQPINSVQYIHIDSVDYKTNYPLIKINLTINNFGEFDNMHIRDDDISIYEDGNIVKNINTKKIPESVDFRYFVFSFDASKSINHKFLKKLKYIAKELASSIGLKDKIAIYQFHNDAKMLNSFINNKIELLKNIDGIERYGEKTILYNAIFDSIDILSTLNSNRKAIIVFSDGKDEGSNVNESDVIHFAQAYLIPIYFICDTYSQKNQSVERISRMTGGKIFYSSNTNIAGIYQSILSNINHISYTIEYSTKLIPNGNNHTIDVRLKHNSIRDRETVTIDLNKNIMLYSNSNMIMNILLLLILLMLTLLFIVVVYKKIYIGRKDLQEKSANQNLTSKILNHKIQMEEKERIEDVKTLSSLNPEYNFANAWLIQKEGPSTGKKYPIYWEECTIGRSKDNSIEIDDETVSSCHGKIKCVRNIYYLFDLVSENGTYLNNKKLIRPKSLYDWDEIKIGRTTFIFRKSKRAL